MTIAGQTHRVPEPFLVMATQNPIETEGTYPLPEAQVDRFMMKILIGYPSVEEEFVIVERVTGPAPDVAAVATPQQLSMLQRECRLAYVDPSMIQYAVKIVAADTWLVSLWHGSLLGGSPDEPSELARRRRALQVRVRLHVKKRWLAGDVSSAGDLGILLLRELALRYSVPRERLHEWLRQWENDFYIVARDAGARLRPSPGARGATRAP